MTGLGTLINMGAVALGGIVGLLCGSRLKESQQETILKASGVAVLFIALAGALEGMLAIDGGRLVSGRSMLVTLSLALGAVVGEFLRLEDRLESFGAWLKEKSGNGRDNRFIDAFVTTTLTVCIGAMAIIGAIQDGILGDISILVTKSVLDFIIVLVMTCSMGKGCAFAAIPIGILQGSVTVLATVVKPLLTEAALANLSLVGAILIFCVGVNLVWGKLIKTANLLPAIVFAVAAAFMNL